MHGAGNDFVLVDARGGRRPPATATIRAMGDRHTGIGFDQMLVVVDSGLGGCVAGYRIFNADGSAAEQCGNGARCVAAWLQRDGVIDLNRPARLDSPAGEIGVVMASLDDVQVEMGEPNFGATAIGLDAPEAAGSTVALALGKAQWPLHPVSMGNPHAVLEVVSLDDPKLQELGPALSCDPRFANGCNVGFVLLENPHFLQLRVHERGAGWTQACGSGACAAAAAMITSGRCQSPVQVRLPGGQLEIRWDGTGHNLWMRGPASFVFEGRWPLS